MAGAILACPDHVETRNSTAFIPPQVRQVQQSLPAGPPSPFSQILEWGRYGVGNGRFTDLKGVGVDDSDRAYVLDGVRIEVFTGSGAFLSAWDVDLDSQSLAVGPGGRVYVGAFGGLPSPAFRGGRILATGFRYRILEYGLDGRLIQDLPVNFVPVALAVSPQGKLHAVDRERRLVIRFNRRLEVEQSWPTGGSLPGREEPPVALAFGAQGHILALDPAGRITEFTADGRPVNRWDVDGYGRSRYLGLATDSLERIFVSDYERSQILTFTNDGNRLASWGGEGEDPGRFRSPYKMAVDTSGDLYVADLHNYRIQRLRRNSEPFAKPPAPPRLLLHVSSPIRRQACRSLWLPDCGDATVAGDLAGAEGPFCFVYLLAARESAHHVGIIECGIQYDQGLASNVNDRHGIDILEWSNCSPISIPTPPIRDGTAGKSKDPRPQFNKWPEPGSGISLAWEEGNCRKEEIVVAGYFYVAAYSEDSLRVTPNPRLGECQVSECVRRVPRTVTYTLRPSQMGSVCFSPGAVRSGFNPCDQ